MVMTTDVYMYIYIYIYIYRDRVPGAGGGSPMEDALNPLMEGSFRVGDWGPAWEPGGGSPGGKLGS
jgi:hypothetical protein